MSRAFAQDVASILILACHVGLPAAAYFPQNQKLRVAPFRRLHQSRADDSAAECALPRSTGTVYSVRSFLVGRITPTVMKLDFVVGSLGLPRSPVVTRRVSPPASSPALRRSSDSEPTVAASATRWPSVTLTSSVTALTTEGLSVRSSAT